MILRWSSIVNKSKQFDFITVNRIIYLKKEIALTCSFNDDFIALPLIVTAIPNTSFVDCTSVYGYCGPISSLNFEDIPSKNITYFKEQLLGFLSNAIVTVFSRLHPLILMFF
jgi:hypothetical protein